MPLITNPGVVVVCLIVMKEFITFQVCFWAKWPRFAVCYHRQTDFTRACLPIFSLWVSIRHPRLDSEGVYCTPLTLNLLQEFLIPGYSPRCFFGRGSEGVSEKTENRFRQHCRKRFRSSKPLVNTHPFAPCRAVGRSSAPGSVPCPSPPAEAPTGGVWANSVNKSKRRAYGAKSQYHHRQSSYHR